MRRRRTLGRAEKVSASRTSGRSTDSRSCLGISLRESVAEPPSIALIARNEHIGEKLHLYAYLAFALAGLASPTWDVEQKWLAVRPRAFASLVAAKISRIGRMPQIGHRIGARRPSKGSGRPERHRSQTPCLRAAVGATRFSVPLCALHGGIEHIVNQGRFSRPAHPGMHVRVFNGISTSCLEVARSHPADGASDRCTPSRRLKRDREVSPQVFRGQRALVAQ